MMQVFNDPPRMQWEQLLDRPVNNATANITDVRNILAAVKTDGDDAIRKYSAQFDGNTNKDLAVSAEKIKEAVGQIPVELREAIDIAVKNISTFHRKKSGPVEVVETMPGIRCWKKVVPVENVGLYIPGGTAPLFSTVLMLGIPARIAGCRRIVLCTPARNGIVHPAILYAASVAGITEVYGVGGAQAIAAMAYGTNTIPRVDKIFGPGNSYVTLAKQLVQMEGVAIDLPAGPSELCVVASDGAAASYIAADLLAQAEHGADSQVIFISTSQKLIPEVLNEVDKQLRSLPRKEVAAKALENSKALYVPGISEAIDMMNVYAPEHLLLMGKDAVQAAEKVKNAGSVFIGDHSPEAAGDYATGTNHTLPTSGYAKAYSGVSTDSFQKTISFQELTRSGLEGIAGSVMTMAQAEGLEGHARSVGVRGAGRISQNKV